MNRIFPTNLRLALDSREMSLTALAKSSKIPYKRLKELSSDLEQRYSGLFQPLGHDVTAEELEVIASWLNYPEKFFSEKAFEIYKPRICVLDY